MRKMDENIATAGIRTRFCIIMLRVYLGYLKKKHKLEAVWRSIVDNN